MTTLPLANLQVSFVISTFNRRNVLLETLARLDACGLERDAFEVFVVDNASTDGTAATILGKFPSVKVLRQTVNRGSCAKNVALPLTRGRFVVFLDDDSFPHAGSVARMTRHFDDDPDLGAAVFTVHLRDGSNESSAYPDVFIGCGTGFRRRALEEVGGLPQDFFMQAEEYDLSLRLLNSGWTVRSFDDLHVTHLKSPAARRARRTMQLDVRNNLILATRYFPDRWVNRFAVDWLRRYYKLAALKRQRASFVLGAMRGLSAALRPGNRRPISETAFESFAKVREIESRLRAAQQTYDLRSVLFIDVGKNILPFWLAAQRLGILVVAIADDTLTAGGRRRAGTYRGTTIVSDEEARTYAFDASIVANLSPVQSRVRRERWRSLDFRPVIDLFEEAPLYAGASNSS